jgi:ethanolamine utilization protein EutA
MTTVVKLVGLDFGTTTSSALIARARLAHNSVTGRMQLDEVRECYRSELVFTPVRNDGSLDEEKLAELMDGWLAAGAINPGEVFGGGALLTGLTAQKANAAALTRLIRTRLADALVATADDPCLESWLAFLGNCAGLSRAHPDLPILNLDVGGGTTNLALGIGGEVLRTGCLFVGARHVQLVPGTYRIAKLSPYAQACFGCLGMRKAPGDCLDEAEVAAVLDLYLALLEGAAAGRSEPFQDPVARQHQQVAFRLPADVAAPVVTFSGGVGELVYGHLEGKPWPPTTFFGDLGIDLARRIVASTHLGSQLHSYRPAAAGRATVCGLLRHSTEISGSTLFLSQPKALPLPAVPVLGTLFADTTDERMADLLALVRRSSCGGCLRVALPNGGAEAVRAVGRRIARTVRDSSFPADHALVLIVGENLGKVLGQYVTEWGALPLHLTVIDEVPMRDARYVHVGRPRGQVVPVSFYGLHEQGEPM